MADYELAVFKSLEQLKAKHDQEVEQMKERVQTEHTVIYTFTQELMELRAMERKFHALK
jgi:hypothetical protein